MLVAAGLILFGSGGVKFDPSGRKMGAIKGLRGWSESGRASVLHEFDPLRLIVMVRGLQVRENVMRMGKTTIRQTRIIAFCCAPSANGLHCGLHPGLSKMSPLQHSILLECSYL